MTRWAVALLQVGSDFPMLDGGADNGHLGGVLLMGIGTGDIYIKRNGVHLMVPAASFGDPVNPRDNIGPDLIPARSWFMRFSSEFFAEVKRRRDFVALELDDLVPTLEENALKSGEKGSGYEWGATGKRRYHLPIGWDGDAEDKELGLDKDVGDAVRETTLVSEHCILPNYVHLPLFVCSSYFEHGRMLPGRSS